MLSDEGFALWCQALGLTEQARSLVAEVRGSPPARLVHSRAGNVAGRYPSRKMERTIQFESHRGELAAIYELEHDTEALEYYDQPPPIKLSYVAKNDRNITVAHTPDFFVLRRASAGWEECKTEEELIRLAERMPRRYVHSDGQWHCPPGASYARQFGLYYRVRSSRTVDWAYQRNILFLEDYLRANTPLVTAGTRATVRRHFGTEKRLALSELIARCRAVSLDADAVYALIAAGDLYVDLAAAPLAEPERVVVFQDQETAGIYSHAKRTSSATTHNPPFIDVMVGAHLLWDGQECTIVNIGSTAISLLSESGPFIDLPGSVFEELVRQGKIAGASAQAGRDEAAKGRLLAASPEALQVANYRYEVIRPRLHGDVGGETAVAERTVRRWLADYRKAERSYGCGYVGLIPHITRRGNRQSKLSAGVRALISEFILGDYETLKQKTKFQVHASLAKECEARGLAAPSYKTFARAVARRPLHEQVEKRRGSRAAYRYEEFYWELEQTTPRHGDRPFEIAHIDHTELEIELVSSSTGRNLGRPWATFLTDAYSRRLLAVYLTFDEPSYRSCMMVVRECVRRHGRLPQILVVDGGPEFSSLYFETLLAWYEVTKKQRPTAKARFGSVCERVFGVTNTRFIHNLLGNTQLMREVRQVTRSVDPKRHAAWTLSRLFGRLSEWAYEVYDTIDHPALGVSPREAFAAGIAKSGSRVHRLIPYDDDFLMLTRPSTAKGTAQVSPGKGVKINYIQYWSNAFRDPEVEKARVPVRYDPMDAGVAYAFVRGQWVQCISEHYAVFRGRSEREVKMATEELRRRHRLYTRRVEITGRKLADFLSSLEAEEVLLVQRLRDAEAKTIFKVIEGGGRLTAHTSNYPEQYAGVEREQVEGHDLDEGRGRRTSVDLRDLEVYEEY